MLNYNHLYYFHVVASEGSFANAAERLGVTQPTISEQVKTLERTLGAALFDRQPAGLRLTDDGRIAFEHTTVMFRAGDHLREALRRDARPPDFLHVGISGAVSRSTRTDFLLPLLGGECATAIRTGDAPDLLRDLRAGELDLIVLETEPPAAVRSALRVVQIDSMVLDGVAATATTPAPDWNNLALLHYRPSSPFRAIVDAYLDASSLRPRLVGEVDDALVLLEAAARGGLVAFVPRAMARTDIASGRLQKLTSVEGTTALFAIHTDTELAQQAVARLQRSIVRTAG